MSISRGIADVPPNVASLLQLQMVERPQGLAALDRWMMAMTPEGHLSPGSLSVLSVLTRPQLGPRIVIDLRPSVVAGDVTVGPASPSEESGDSLSRHYAVAGTRSPWDPRS